MKNYTSTVDAETTIWRIEQILIRCKAMNIMKEYENSQVTSIFFTVMAKQDLPLTIRLPANVDAVDRVLWKRTKKQDARARQRVAEQAKRTAWKLIQDWVEVQMSLIEMGQAELLQVFLPYVWDGRSKKSFFSLAKEGDFRALTHQPDISGNEDADIIEAR